MIPQHDRAQEYACRMVRELRAIDPTLQPQGAFKGCHTWDDVHIAYARQYLDDLRKEMKR